MRYKLDFISCIYGRIVVTDDFEYRRYCKLWCKRNKQSKIVHLSVKKLRRFIVD